MLHLDGYRADLTRSLLEAGRLPYLEYLVSRGRISFETATVDKSETMKVIQSYLTSRLDTEVSGWWQFDRDQFRFRNYWLDPAEVVSYALGLHFPASPTIQDFLAAKGENLVAGMSLARRGVPFDNYARAYVEGIDAVSSHRYHRQADATMRSFLDVHLRIARQGEKSPSLSTLLMAAADEFAHADGVTTEEAKDIGDVAAGEHCFERVDAPDDTVFRLLDEDANDELGGSLRSLEPRYFTRVERSRLGRVSAVCMELPLLETEEGSRRAHPLYVLSYFVLDIELGYLIEALRSIRFGPGETQYLEEPPSLWERLGPEPEAESTSASLFDRTLFIAFGDHGMVDTRRGMADELSISSSLGTGSLDESFLTYLNRRLALTSGAGTRDLSGDVELGIDDQHQPLRVSEPETFFDWQSEDVRATTREAESFANELLEDLRGLVRDELHEQYWWLFFLRSLWIDPKLDGAIDPVSSRMRGMFRRLYLRGVPDYLEAERRATRVFFDDHVRLVYGGGARNNAELFIPACDQAGCSWQRRPRYEEIVAYRGGRASETTLLEALLENPGVGLVFVRRDNELFSPSSRSPMPERLEIEVLDREGNTGTIAVERDAATAELAYRYRVDPESPGDPLGYASWGDGDGTSGTYREWSDRTVRAKSRLTNVVGGIGRYLYSSNPAIGDVLVMNAPGWNFGTNRAGHGGLDRLEKTTFLLVSGPSPSVTPGELRTKLGHLPSLLDVTPTALAYLGYEPEEVEAFARSGFETYLEDWRSRQLGEILSRLGNFDTVQRAGDQAGIDDLSLAPLEPSLSRLLLFIETEPSRLSVAADPSLDGDVLLLNDEN
jgi:hypothetical protein